MRFVDTSFWVALFRARERHHSEARALWFAGAGPLLTSNLVLGETWTLANRRDGHTVALQIIDSITQSPRLSIERVNDQVEDDAWRWLRRHDEREYSFVDGTSFTLMRRRRIREALAFDGDFSAAGFIEVRPS